MWSKILEWSAKTDNHNQGIGIPKGPLWWTWELFVAFAVGILPVSETFDLYAKLGLVQIDYDDSDGDSADASGVSFGFGASFDVSDALGFNLEYIQYPDGEYDEFPVDIETTALNLGVYWKF